MTERIKKMKNLRNDKNTTARYSSFAEVAAVYGKEPFVKRTKDVKKLKKQRMEFSKKHRCKACGQPMTYIGGNVMTCQNEACKGIKHVLKNGEAVYEVSRELLDSKGAEIANNLFGI